MTELYVVVAYDIPDDRRRLKVAKVLEGHGERLQYSLFECRMTRVQFLKMREKLKDLVFPDEDAVSFYFLCAEDVKKIERLGGRRPLPDGALFVGWEEGH